MAIAAWRKQQRIELFKTIAQVTATVNPDKAQKALRNLVEEMFPEVAKEREQAVEKAMEIMEVERQKSYAVAPVGHGLDRGAFGRFRNILKNKKGPRRTDG